MGAFRNQHPAAEWLNDRVLALFTRHEAPVLKMPEVGQTVYLFQGVVSSRRSQPVLVKWFGVSDGTIIPFADLLERLSRAVTNPGSQFDDAPLYQGLPAAIKQARDHLEQERVSHCKERAALLRPGQLRVREWYNKKMREFEKRETSGSLRTEADRRRPEPDREEVTKRVAARKEWVENGLKTEPDAYLRLAAVLI